MRRNRSHSKKRPSAAKRARRQLIKKSLRDRRSTYIRDRSGKRQEQMVRVLAALNRIRRGEAKSASAAARAERTTLRAMWRLVPDALIQNRRGGRIRVTPTDRYTHPVEILTNDGALTVTARGSRQRELAGRHRATYRRVLAGKESPTALEQYRGKKVGGHELISDYEQLASFAHAEVLGQLDSLYVSPDVSV